MHWIFLILAIVSEVIGTTFMKLSDGFTKLWPSIGLFIGYILAFVFLTLCLKKIEVSVAYAIWAGAGVALISVVGFLFFQETINWVKVVSLMAIIGGVVGLRLAS